MKKILIILLACCALSACGDRVKKGDGSNWYLEPISIGARRFWLVHSTFDCPSVKNGVIIAIPADNKPGHTFCTKCMNEELIKKWDEWGEER